jgi:glycosyltransferase involved in cell wall biosynthesis
MSARVCLITTGQPATNPRAVREADALADAGYDVHMIAAFAGQWAVDVEPAFMRGRRWTLQVIDWRRDADPRMFWQSGLRHRAALGLGGWAGSSLEVAERAIARPAIELRNRALRHHADLYIAHNLGALPAAARAAARHHAKLGFDAEDFHSGQLGFEADASLRQATAAVEHHYLPYCDYVTASSTGIADAYAALVRGSGPHVVLNVVSRHERGPRRHTRAADDPVRLYWCSQTIGPDRGLEDAVRAMATLPTCVELHLRGTWADGYERMLRRLAEQCGVSQTRLASHPPAAPDAMTALAGEHHVGLALEPGTTTNNRLALSNKLFSYLMAGVPLVASLTPGQAWLLEQAPSVGWGFRPRAPTELSAVLRRCIERPDLLAAAGNAARHAAETRFCWEVEQQAFLNAVAGVLTSRGERRDEREAGHRGRAEALR